MTQEVKVQWTPEDVIEEAESQGKFLSLKKAEELLHEIGDNLVDAMLSVGWEIISDAVSTMRKEGKCED